MAKRSIVMPPDELEQEGWRQLAAGIALLSLSQLVIFESAALRFRSNDSASFETAAAALHQKFGRVHHWITFNAGAEYFAKAACLLHGQQIVAESDDVWRIPYAGMAQAWMQDAVSGRKPSVETQRDFGELGQINGRLKAIFKDKQTGTSVFHTFELLRRAIRNRDAHAYKENLRKSHFHLVPDLFVPAFNSVLKTLDQDGVRHRARAYDA